MALTLRPYQEEAVSALQSYLCERPGNPCVVLPTGSGKSVVMAEAIRRWSVEAPWFRCCILAHRKELVQQNAEKLRLACPEQKIGLFSAGLGRKDYDSRILFASIDSVYKRHSELQPFDALFVDEAHRIPPSGEGKYRTFIGGCQRWNPSLKVVGWTATPFRMGCGPICHRDHILNEVCYEASVVDLIHQGYLSNIRSKVGEAQPNLDGVKRNSGGDYIINSLSKSTNRDRVVSAAVEEAVAIMIREKRQSAVFFCVDIEHSEKVSAKLSKMGIYAPAVTSKTRRDERDRIVRDFKARRIHAICNVSVFTEGFDAPHIDCIVLLRPTLSAGLFSQMVGRGLRIHPTKRDCLVLDFANCIDEHGPIDLLGRGDRTVTIICKECRESFSKAVKVCPACGWVVPKKEVERAEAIEKERRLHGSKASSKNILSNQPETHQVDAVYANRWVKPGKPDSIKLRFRCGLSMFSYWLCLDHPGTAGRLAHKWYERYVDNNKTVTVMEALGDMFLCQKIKESVRTITVRKNGKYKEIVGWNQAIPSMEGPAIS